MIDITKNKLYFDQFDNIKYFEHFFISFDALNDSKFMIIINILIDNIFKYCFIDKNITHSLIELILYVFIFETKSQYNVIEFKKLFIDFDVFTKSTKNIDQLKTFQRFDNSIQFDANITESIKFIFEIEFISFIESIHFDTFIKLIVFHIVIVNILFFYV